MTNDGEPIKYQFFFYKNFSISTFLEMASFSNVASCNIAKETMYWNSFHLQLPSIINLNASNVLCESDWRACTNSDAASTCHSRCNLLIYEHNNVLIDLYNVHVSELLWFWCWNGILSQHNSHKYLFIHVIRLETHNWKLGQKCIINHLIRFASGKLLSFNCIPNE